jgi:1-acyl-sn-glycerol-3-phosphate acyltransferase
MLYRLLKPIASFTIKICFRKININEKALLQHNGPLLLASNHPNSFLDAILLCILFKKPLYALTRGDTFKKKWIAKILYALHMLPVYREREGMENMHRNYDTFDKCLEIFKKNGIVLVFSEALCVNEWHLRPIKKGTARLIALAWQQNIPLQILPVGLNYSNFNKIGKVAHINFGNVITKKEEQLQNNKLLNELTQNIGQQLSNLVYEIDGNDKVTLKKYFAQPTGLIKKIILFFPAVAGFLIHSPIYYPISIFIYNKAKKSGHYDSLIIAVFFLTYPFFVLTSILLLYILFANWWCLLCIPLLPFCAWSYVQVKK